MTKSQRKGFNVNKKSAINTKKEKDKDAENEKIEEVEAKVFNYRCFLKVSERRMNKNC